MTLSRGLRERLSNLVELRGNALDEEAWVALLAALEAAEQRAETLATTLRDIAVALHYFHSRVQYGTVDWRTCAQSDCTHIRVTLVDYEVALADRERTRNGEG